MFDGSTEEWFTWLTSLSLSHSDRGEVIAEPSSRLARQQEKAKAQARARASRASSGEVPGRGRTTIRAALLIAFLSRLLLPALNGEVGNLRPYS